MIAIVTAYCLAAAPCADGTRAQVGTIAAPRHIPFGTRVRIEGKIYIVHDRMNKRFSNRWDVFIPDCQTAKQWGVKKTQVQISGTAKGGITEAKPMHLSCAVAKQWDEGMGIALTWPNAELCHRDEPVAVTKTQQR